MRLLATHRKQKKQYARPSRMHASAKRLIVFRRRLLLFLLRKNKKGHQIEDFKNNFVLRTKT